MRESWCWPPAACRALLWVAHNVVSVKLLSFDSGAVDFVLWSSGEDGEMVVVGGPCGEMRKHPCFQCFNAQGPRHLSRSIRLLVTMRPHELRSFEKQSSLWIFARFSTETISTCRKTPKPQIQMPTSCRKGTTSSTACLPHRSLERVAGSVIGLETCVS